jgi:hypothetical protein
VRLGLVTKLQILTVGLVFLTCAVDHRLHVLARMVRRRGRARAQARTLSTMLADVVDEPLRVSDLAGIEQIVDSLSPGTNVAYVAVPRRQAQRRVVTPLRRGARGPVDPDPGHRRDAVGDANDAYRRTIGSTSYLEVVAPVRLGGTMASRTGAEAPSATPPLGHVQVGMSLMPQAARFRTTPRARSPSSAS